MSKKILLADDSITIHKVISITFADEDFDLKIVSDGDSAVAEAREFVPDLVMADVSMPGKSGYEVCESIKRDPRLSHTPVLILAGTFEPIDTEELQRVGADDCIVKPFESQELIEKVHNLLEKNTAPHSAVDGEVEETGLDLGEIEMPVVEDLVPESPEAWDERDFIIAETVEEKSQPLELSADDATGGVTAEEITEEIAEEPEKEELRKIVAEEFEELDLGGGDVETVEELEEIMEVEDLWEEDDADASAGESEEEPLAVESELAAKPGAFDDGEAVEALLSEPDSGADVEESPQQAEEPEEIPTLDIEGEADLTSDEAALSPPWLGDVTEEDGVDHSEVDVESDEGVAEEAPQGDLTGGLEPVMSDESAEEESEEKTVAPFEEDSDESTFQQDEVEDAEEVDEGGDVEGGVSFDIPPSELEDSEESVTFEVTAPELEPEESCEPQPFETAASEDGAQPEISEPFEIPEPEVAEELGVEVVEEAPEAPLEEVEGDVGEESEPEGEVASEMETPESPIGFEAVAPSGDEDESPLDVEAEEGLSCAVVETEPEAAHEEFEEDFAEEEPAIIPEPDIEPEKGEEEAGESLSYETVESEAQPEAEGLAEDGIDEESAPISEPVIEQEEPERGEDEDEAEEVAPPETLAAHVMDKEKLEEIVARVARSVLEEVAWEVVPEMVAEMVKEEIRKSVEAAAKKE